MKNRNTIDYIVIFFAILGLAAMLYLLFSFTFNVIPQSSCDINNFLNCSDDVTSNYSTFLGIKWFYYGIGFFSLIIILSVLRIIGENDKRRKMLSIAVLGLSSFGSIVAFYLIYVEIFLIHHICLPCIIGDTVIFGLLIASVFRFTKFKDTL